MLTDLVTLTAAHPDDAGCYNNSISAGVLVLGVISPEEELIVNPAGALKVPPVYAPVPFKVTGCAVVSDVQKGAPA
jgi:hypothetical protein